MKFSRAEILLVEDSQEDLDLTLHSLGHERVANDIIVARDGEEALDLLFCQDDRSKILPGLFSSI